VQTRRGLVFPAQTFVKDMPAPLRAPGMVAAATERLLLASSRGHLRLAAPRLRRQSHGAGQLKDQQAKWLALLYSLGSDDIAEFTVLIAARQERNRRLLSELCHQTERQMSKV
jgi:hypothetical protein